MNNKINIPKEANYLIHTLKEHGYEAYIVGGCVRDSLVGKEPNDWDLCTSATPEEMLHVFPQHTIPFTNSTNKENEYLVGAPILTGAKYGTVVFPVNGELFEVTTFRKEAEYSDNRHPDAVEYAKTIEEDLARRDFTINAMAYNDEDGLIDPFGGKKDLKSKHLRCVGSSKERFNEDSLRILRALRFATTEGLFIEEDTEKAIEDLYTNIGSVSMDRIRKEFCKMIVSTNFPNTLIKYRDVFAQFIPELKSIFDFEQHNPYHEFTVFEHTARALTAVPFAKTIVGLSPCDDLTVKLAIFFHDIGKPGCATPYKNNPNSFHYHGHGKISAQMTNEIMRRMKFDNHTREAVVELVNNHDIAFDVSESHVRRWLNKIGPEQFERLLAVRIADICGQQSHILPERIEKVEKVCDIYKKVMEKADCFSKRDLSINGNDLIALGYGGKEIGNKLEELLQKVIDGELENSRDTLLQAATPVQNELDEEETER